MIYKKPKSNNPSFEEALQIIRHREDEEKLINVIENLNYEELGYIIGRIHATDSTWRLEKYKTALRIIITERTMYRLQMDMQDVICEIKEIILVNNMKGQK